PRVRNGADRNPRRRRVPVIALLALIASIGACSGDSPPDLFVNLKTDLRTPQDFVVVRTTVTRGLDGPEIARTTAAGFDIMGDLLAGVRVADFRDVPSASLVVQVEL